MEIKWSEQKDLLLQETRNISFEEVAKEILKGDFVGPEKNPVHENQSRVIVRINGYPIVVPFVIEENGDWFLKTAYPCRKMKGRV